MKNTELEQCYDKFIKASILHGEAIKKGDSKIANRQYHLLKGILKLAEGNPALALKFYQRLMKENNPSVKGWACAHSLALNINIEAAEKILAQQSQDKKLGILRLDAEMILKQWRKNGYLKV